jgi:hypothetical protein
MYFAPREMIRELLIVVCLSVPKSPVMHNTLIVGLLFFVNTVLRRTFGFKCDDTGTTCRSNGGGGGYEVFIHLVCPPPALHSRTLQLPWFTSSNNIP